MLGDERADHRLEPATPAAAPRTFPAPTGPDPGFYALRMGLPEHGMTKDEIVAALTAKRARDARWQDGRTFGMVYDGGAEVHEVAEAAAQMFLHENALNTQAFPSLGEIQSEVVGACADLFHGARRRGRVHDVGRHREHPHGGEGRARARPRRARHHRRPRWSSPRARTPRSTRPRTTSASACTRRRCAPTAAPTSTRWPRVVNENTVLVVGSAPQYPQGVIDPIPELADARGDGRRVDARRRVHGRLRAAVHGAERRDVPPWDFRVAGVTTISADVHKLGYAPKGASVIVHRTKELRRYQTFVFDDWLGGFYASPEHAGLAAGPPDGDRVGRHAPPRHRRLPPADPGDDRRGPPHRRGRPRDRRARGARRTRRALFAIAVDARRVEPIDVFALGDALRQRGWHLDRQTPPDSLHATVSAANAPVVDEFLGDLAACVDEVGAAHTDDRSTNYATLE